MWTIRTRLTLWLGAALLAVGIGLLVFNFVLLRNAFPAEDDRLRDTVATRVGVERPARPQPFAPGGGRAGPQVRPTVPRPTPAAPPTALDFDAVVDETRRELREETLQAVLLQSGLLLGVTVLLTAGGGWWLAGRMLRPVSDISDTVRRISEGRLDQRVALGGPRDELRDLGDQFDSMLDRLEDSFRSQRDFVSNASHELRTPLAVMRTELDVTLADPEVTVADLRRSAAVVCEAIDRADQLIAALLTLARADSGGGTGRAAGQGAAATDHVDLGVIAAEVVAQRADFIAGHDVELQVDPAPAPVTGDRVLLTQMIDNLVANGTLYNEPGGSLEVVTADRGPHVLLRVTNSGAVIDPESAERLFERFTRLDEARDRASGGAGLGLAIVRAVAERHGGAVSARARPEGGLEVTVILPPSGAASLG